MNCPQPRQHTLNRPLKDGEKKKKYAIFPEISMPPSHLLFEVFQGMCRGGEVGLMSEVQIRGGEQQRMWRGVDMSPLKHRYGLAERRGEGAIIGKQFMVKA